MVRRLLFDAVGIIIPHINMRVQKCKWVECLNSSNHSGGVGVGRDLGRDNAHEPRSEAPRSSGAGPAALAFDKGWASNLDPDVLFSVGSGKFKEDLDELCSVGSLLIFRNKVTEN